LLLVKTRFGIGSWRRKIKSLLTWLFWLQPLPLPQSRRLRLLPLIAAKRKTRRTTSTDNEASAFSDCSSLFARVHTISPTLDLDLHLPSRSSWSREQGLLWKRRTVNRRG
jgi:hypothetical protein